MDFEEAFNIRHINLEPRLQEYMRRKKFNQENDITPDIPEEQEFCITKDDKKMMKRHKQGKTKLYTGKRLAKQSHFVQPDTNGFDSMTADFKQDPRYERLKKKMTSHKRAQAQIRNFDGLDEDYDIFHRSNPYDLRPDKRPSQIAKPYDDPMNDDLSWDENNDAFMMSSRDLVLGPSRPRKEPRSSEIDSAYSDNRGQYCYNTNRKSNNPSAYHHTPKISYRQRLQPQRVHGGLPHSRDVQDVIGNLDNYNRHLDNTYEYINGCADLDTHTFIPDTRIGTQRGNYNNYQAVPFRYGDGLPDVCLEDSLRGGIRDSSKKSIGFKNPFDHQFDYISEDISDPNHSVQMWPSMTRGQNKEIARPHSGAARSEQRIQRKQRHRESRNPDPRYSGYARAYSR